MSGWKEISELVLKHDCCCGCGVCAGVCPQNALEMRFNEYGEYKPYLVAQCTTCGFCSKVCPFVPGNPNEDEISKEEFGSVPGAKHAPETGHYLGSYVGHAADPDMRWNGASGGLMTLFLCNLLEKQLVDYVITVAPNDDPERLFEYRIIDNPQEVRRCSKSAYYPVELSGVLQQVRKQPGQYALVGLPCVAKAIRLAQRQLPVLRERVHFILGLVCGQSKSRFYTDYLACKAGLEDTAARVIYREKTQGNQANHYTFMAESACGRQCRLGWLEAVSEVWCNDWFKMNSCFHCLDVFAECADWALMDAWLPEYTSDHRGTSLAIIRCPAIQRLLQEDARVCMKPIPLDSVMRSQQGAILAKKVMNRPAATSTVMRNTGLDARASTGWFESRALRRNWSCRVLVASEAKRLWRQHMGDLSAFERALAPSREQLERSERILRMCRKMDKFLRSPLATARSVTAYRFQRVKSSVLGGGR